MARAGLDVFAGVRSLAAGGALTGASAGYAGKITPIQLDVTDQLSVDAAAARVKQALAGEPLFGLVNNAGVGMGGPLLYQPIDEIRRCSRSMSSV